MEGNAFENMVQSVLKRGNLPEALANKGGKIALRASELRSLGIINEVHSYFFKSAINRDEALPTVEWLTILRGSEDSILYRLFGERRLYSRASFIELGETGISMHGVCGNEEVSMAVMRVIKEALEGKAEVGYRSESVHRHAPSAGSVLARTSTINEFRYDFNGAVNLDTLLDEAIAWAKGVRKEFLTT